jgi:putative tricarboxylic transport membrane protein
MTAAPASPAPAGTAGRGSGWRVTPLTVFLGALALILLGYTVLAFDLEWRTQAGRIGPGFFPRIVGLLGLLLCTVSAVLSMRRPPDRVDEDRVDEAGADEGQPDLGRHPLVLVVVSAAAAASYLLFLTLGAVVTTVLFLLVTLAYLDRENPWRVVAVSFAVPIGLYLLFQVGLNAGLPAGILPTI